MWRKWKVGDRVKDTVNDFDGRGSWNGTLTEMHEDHAIVEADGMHLWLDDDTADMFQRSIWGVIK